MSLRKSPKKSSCLEYPPHEMLNTGERSIQNTGAVDVLVIVMHPKWWQGGNLGTESSVCNG